MAGVRSLLARVARIEAATTGASPLVRLYGSLEAFEAATEADIEAGALDRGDMTAVLVCIDRWHREGVFGMWYRNGVWELGG